jgi:X-X-X-Leu-X-X-Gly heptad repeat protein
LVLSLIGLGVSKSTSPTITVVPGTEASRAQHLADTHFGPSVLVPILLEGPAKQLDRQGPALVRDLTRRGDTRVLSAWDAGAAGAQLRPNPRAAMIVAAIAKSEKDMVKTEQAKIEKLVARDTHGPVTASVTGQPSIDRAMRDVSIDTTRSRMAITLPILFLALLLLLRAPVGALLVTAVAGTTAYAGLGVTALLGKAIDIDSIDVILGTMTGLALGAGYGLLFYRRWRTELREDVTHHDAAHAASEAVNTSGRALLIGGTAVVTSLVVASLIGPTEVLRSLAVTAVICGFLAIGTAVVAMPAALVLLGDRAQAFSFGLPGFIARPWNKLSGEGNAVIAHAAPMGALATGLLVVLALPLFSIDTGPPSAKFLPTDNPARKSYERVAQVMGPGWPTPYNMVLATTSAKAAPITTRAMLRKFDRFQANLVRDKRIASVVGPGLLADTSQQLNALPAGLADSSKLLKGGKKQLGLLASGLGQAHAGVRQLRSGLIAAAAGGGQLQGGSTTLHAMLAKARAGAATATAGLGTALNAANRLRDGAGQALAGSKKITTGLSTAANASRTGAPIVKQMAADVNTSSAAVKDATSTAQSLGAQLDEASAQVSKLPPSAEKSAALGAISSASSAAGGLSSSLTSTSTTLSGAAGIASAFSDQVTQLASGLGQLYAGSSQLQSGIGKLENGNAALAVGIGKLHGGGNQLTSGLGQLTDGAGQLEAGISQLSGGLAGGVGPSGQLVSGLGTAATKVAKFRSSLPSTKDLERLQAQSPGLFDSGYFVLAAVQGAPPAARNQASFLVDLNNGGDAAMITVISKYASEDPRSVALGEDLADHLDGFAHANDLQGAMGGQAGALGDFRSSAADSIWAVVIGVSIVVTLLLILLLRTVVLPVVAVAFDLLTAAATFGLVTLLFSGDNPPFGGLGYVDPMTIIAVFAAIFGITILYEVMLLERTREEFLATGDPHGALRTGLHKTAAAATGAAVAMIAAMVPFATSDLILVRQLGVAVGIAIIIDAIIVRPVLLPAAVELLGRWSWWPTSRKAPPHASEPTEPSMPAPPVSAPVPLQPVGGGQG